MARKRPRTEKSAPDDVNEELSYEEYSGGGARPRGTGGRRNVAAGAQEFEPEDYNEQNRRNVQGEGGGGIMTGNYEDDYGPGARGLRHPDFHSDQRPEDQGKVLRRGKKGDGASDDFPTGTWSKQKIAARLRNVKTGKARARPETGRGVGVKNPRTRSTTPKRGTSRKAATPRRAASAGRAQPGTKGVRQRARR